MAHLFFAMLLAPMMSCSASFSLGTEASLTESAVQPERRFPRHRYPLDPPPRDDWKLSDEAQAVDAASKTLEALLPAPDAREPRAAPEAQLLAMDEDRGPCVSRGETLWRVTLNPVYLGRGDKVDLSRRAVCYFAPVDGSLRRVEIINDALQAEPPAEPSPREYLRQLDSVGPERWGLAKFPADSRTSLTEALMTVDREMGGVASAKLIAIHRITWSYGPAPRRTQEEGGGVDLEFKDVWSIDLRGLPPFRASRDDIPVEARNHIRHVVDATTGEWIMASTVPQPERKPQEAPTRPDPAPPLDGSAPSKPR